MTIYILALDDTEMSLNRLTAALGFGYKGEEVVMFNWEDFNQLPLANQDIVVGGIGFAHQAFQRLGIAIPALSSIPPELFELAGRKIWQTTMAEVRSLVGEGQRIFVELDISHDLIGPISRSPRRLPWQRY